METTYFPPQSLLTGRYKSQLVQIGNPGLHFRDLIQASSGITSPLMSIIFPEYMTPLTTAAEAVEGLREGQQTGQIVEIFGRETFY